MIMIHNETRLLFLGTKLAHHFPYLFENYVLGPIFLERQQNGEREKFGMKKKIFFATIQEQKKL